MSTRKKILCVGDSLGLPRESISYEDTWYYFLTNQCTEYEYIPRFQRALTTQDLVGSNGSDFLELYKPNIVITQVGIVDCAPRYFPKDSILVKIINHLPKAPKNLFWKTWKSFRSRKEKHAYVSPPEYHKNLRIYFSRCYKLNIEKVIFIKIGIPGKEMIQKNPRIIKQIKIYNHFVEKLKVEFPFVEIIDPLGTGQDALYLQDGYHISRDGAITITNQLFQTLKK